MGHTFDFEDLRFSANALFVLTIVVTFYRCYSRYSRNIWGHDDSAVLFSSVIFGLYVTAATILAQASFSRAQRITGTYLMIFGSYTPVWGGRVSIALTVVRVTPWRPQKKLLLGVAAFFVAQYLLLVAQTYWECEITRPEWKNIPGSICVFSKAVPITQIITTVISDGILVLAPLMIVKGVRAPALRFRLFGIFSVSLVTTMAAATHALLMLYRPGILEAIFGGVEAVVSIVVSSMSVIIPAILRALGTGDPFMREDTVDPRFDTRVEIVHMTSTRAELGLPITRGATVSGAEFRDREGVITLAAPPRPRDTVCLDEKVGKRHYLVKRSSDGSLGTSITKVELQSEECDITDYGTLEVENLPVVEKDTEIDVEEKAKHQDT